MICMNIGTYYMYFITICYMYIHMYGKYEISNDCIHSATYYMGAL